MDARITLKPLLDVIPFFGGLTVSLLKVHKILLLLFPLSKYIGLNLPLPVPPFAQVPHVDLKLVIIRGVDLMALPVVKDGVKLALKVRINRQGDIIPFGIVLIMPRHNPLKIQRVKRIGRVQEIKGRRGREVKGQGLGSRPVM